MSSALPAARSCTPPSTIAFACAAEHHDEHVELRADMLGGGSPTAYVDGLHQAALAGAGLALLGAIVAALLIRPRRTRLAEQPAGAALALDAA